MADKFQKAAWLRVKAQAIAKSLTPDYKGCALHINAILGRDSDGVPSITGYALSDWHGGETVATYINGHERN